MLSVTAVTTCLSSKLQRAIVTRLLFFFDDELGPVLVDVDDDGLDDVVVVVVVVDVKVDNADVEVGVVDVVTDEEEEEEEDDEAGFEPLPLPSCC